MRIALFGAVLCCAFIGVHPQLDIAAIFQALLGPTTQVQSGSSLDPSILALFGVTTSLTSDCNLFVNTNSYTDPDVQAMTRTLSSWMCTFMKTLTDLTREIVTMLSIIIEWFNKYDYQCFNLITWKPADMYVIYQNGNAGGITQLELVGNQTGVPTSGIYKYRNRLEDVITDFKPIFATIDEDGGRIFTIEDRSDDNEPDFVLYTRDACTGKYYDFNSDDHEDNLLKYIALDPTGNYLFQTSYNKGYTYVSDVSDSFDFDDGDSESASGSNDDATAKPYQVSVHPLIQDLLLVAYQGNDKIRLIKFDNTNGDLSTITPDLVLPTGFGPTEFAITNDGRFLYVVGQNALKVAAYLVTYSSFKITSYTSVDTESIVKPGDTKKVDCYSRIRLHPNQKFLYALACGHDSIAMFSVNTGDGTLTSLGLQGTQGTNPVYFEISPDGSRLAVANFDSNSVTTFIINADGRLISPSTVSGVNHPVTILFQKPFDSASVGTL